MSEPGSRLHSNDSSNGRMFVQSAAFVDHHKKAVTGISINGQERVSERFLRVLEWLAEELPGAALRDPGNASNVVTELMTEEEKWRVSNAAWMSVRAGNWTEVM